MASAALWQNPFGQYSSFTVALPAPRLEVEVLGVVVPLVPLTPPSSSSCSPLYFTTSASGRGSARYQFCPIAGSAGTEA